MSDDFITTKAKNLVFKVGDHVIRHLKDGPVPYVITGINPIKWEPVPESDWDQFMQKPDMKQ